MDVVLKSMSVGLHQPYGDLGGGVQTYLIICKEKLWVYSNKVWEWECIKICKYFAEEAAK
jgi:hypothetical protein